MVFTTKKVVKARVLVICRLVTFYHKRKTRYCKILFMRMTFDNVEEYWCVVSFQ